MNFDFGSDSPIEDPVIYNTVHALKDSAMCGVPALLGDGLRYHSYTDKIWTPNTFTEFEDEKVKKVIFRGKDLI